MATASVQLSRYDQADVIATIKQTVAKGASDAQLKMFLEVCRSTGLDPFLKEIYFVAEKGLIMAARDGYLRVANENPQFDGMETRVERDEKNVPIKATCSVWRKDRTHAITCEAFYSEYKKSSPVWSQYPSAMISKVAEVLALKRSFAINGVVTEEEMGTSSEPRGSAAAAQEVATNKIAVMSKPQPAAQIIDAQPDEETGSYSYEEEVEMDLEEQLAVAIEVERQKRLTAFSDLKRRYLALGFVKTYHAILGLNSVQQPSDFDDTDAGIAAARKCYREMFDDVSSRERRAAR